MLFLVAKIIHKSVILKKGKTKIDHVPRVLSWSQVFSSLVLYLPKWWFWKLVFSNPNFQNHLDKEKTDKKQCESFMSLPKKNMHFFCGRSFTHATYSCIFCFLFGCLFVFLYCSFCLFVCFFVLFCFCYLLVLFLCLFFCFVCLFVFVRFVLFFCLFLFVLFVCFFVLFVLFVCFVLFVFLFVLFCLFVCLFVLHLHLLINVIFHCLFAWNIESV